MYACTHAPQDVTFINLTLHVLSIKDCGTNRLSSKISQPVCLGAVLFIILVISKNSVFLADCFSGLSVLRFGYSRLIFLNLWLQVYTDRFFPAHQVLPSEPWGPAVNSVFSTGQISKLKF